MAPRVPVIAADDPVSAASLFAALGDPGRWRLIRRLCDEGPMSITRLADGAAVSRQAVTKHLRLMEAVGLVRSARQGREVRWQLERRRLDEARRSLERIATQWDRALDRLRCFVEE